MNADGGEAGTPISVDALRATCPRCGETTQFKGFGKWTLTPVTGRDTPTDDDSPNTFADATKYVISAVVLAVLINLISAEWGWKTLGPLLAFVAWLGLLTFMRWLPSRSRLARYVGLSVVLLLPITATALYWLGQGSLEDPRWTQWLYWDAGVSAALLGAAVLGAPGLLTRYDTMAFTFIIAVTVTLIAPMPGWLKVTLIAAMFIAFMLGFLSIYPPTTGVMGRVMARCQSLWDWLLEDVQDSHPGQEGTHASDTSESPQGDPNPTGTPDGEAKSND